MGTVLEATDTVRNQAGWVLFHGAYILAGEMDNKQTSRYMGGYQDEINAGRELEPGDMVGDNGGRGRWLRWIGMLGKTLQGAS